MTIDELFSAMCDANKFLKHSTPNTRTDICYRPSRELMNDLDIVGMIHKLNDFNRQTAHLHEVDRASLYNTFYIPKSSGGLRRIDAPNPELMTALRVLKTIFEEDFRALYHTSAFAYIKHRSTLDAIKRHQEHESKWFAKFDLHDFFGSTTKEFVMKQLGMIFPFSEVINQPSGRKALETAIDLAFLNGGLPQGTPISPLITNLMMIPIDHELSNKLKKFPVTGKDGKNHTEYLVYTRYADDFLISCKYDFDYKKVQQYMLEVLERFGAPFSLNTKKTRYGSASGKNWNLGLMLNANNQITVGYKRKKEFQKMLYGYVTSARNENRWAREEIQHLQGLYSYYHMVEPEVFDRIITFFNSKYNVNVLNMIKTDLAV